MKGGIQTTYFEIRFHRYSHAFWSKPWRETFFYETVKFVSDDTVWQILVEEAAQSKFYHFLCFFFAFHTCNYVFPFPHNMYGKFQKENILLQRTQHFRWKSQLSFAHPVCVYQ